MSQHEEDTLPAGIQLTPLDDTFRADPYPIFRRLREEAPVHHDDVMMRHLVARHDDVRQVLHDKEFFTDPRKANPGTFTREVLGAELGAGDNPSMLLMDEPDHRRLRSLVAGPFKPKNVERWRPRIREVVSTALDKISGNEFDLIEEFAGPVPTIVIAMMLGIDPGHHDQFKRWSDLSVQVGFNPFPGDEQRAQGEMAISALDDFFRGEIRRRSRTLGDDLLSDMLRAEEEGETLDEDEIIAQCRLLLIAGNVTTCDLIGNATRALLDHPDQLASLRANPELIANTIEETLRYESPVVNSGRIPNRAMTLSDCPLQKGDSVTVILAAANRDPAVYPDPDTFNIEREDVHHHSFGGGRHMCLGAHLARIEAQEAILGLLARYPRLRHSKKGFTYHAIPSFRGFSELWVCGDDC